MLMVKLLHILLLQLRISLKVSNHQRTYKKFEIKIEGHNNTHLSVAYYTSETRKS